MFTKLLSNSTGKVTFNQALDLGAGGNIAFGTDGTLVINGVIGPITTFAPNRGTLTINSGNITGAIGNNDNSLSEININVIGSTIIDSEINANNLNINSRGNNGDINTAKLDINGIGNIIFYEEVKATNFNINNECGCKCYGKQIIDRRRII